MGYCKSKENPKGLWNKAATFWGFDLKNQLGCEILENCWDFHKKINRKLSFSHFLTHFLPLLVFYHFIQLWKITLSTTIFSVSGGGGIRPIPLWLRHRIVWILWRSGLKGIFGLCILCIFHLSFWYKGPLGPPCSPRWLTLPHDAAVAFPGRKS